MTNKSKPAVTTPSGVELSKSEVEKAQHDGALDYIKEGAKNEMRTDTGTTSDPEKSAQAEALRVAPDLNTTFIAPLLDLPLDTLVKRLSNDKVPDPIDLEHAKGLLALERAGRNRTDWVKALCKRIGVDSPYEVTIAGPGYTNDVHPITKL